MSGGGGEGRSRLELKTKRNYEYEIRRRNSHGMNDIFYDTQNEKRRYYDECVLVVARR